MKGEIIINSKNWLGKESSLEIKASEIKSTEELTKFINSMQGINVEKLINKECPIISKT